MRIHCSITKRTLAHEHAVKPSYILRFQKESSTFAYCEQIDVQSIEGHHERQ